RERARRRLLHHRNQTLTGDTSMIIETLIERLRALRLHGMADSLERQIKSENHEALRFEEQLHLMIQNENVERANQSYDKRRRWGCLRQRATADVLLIDDLTVGGLTDQVKRDLLEILDDRYDRKSTIITTQLGLEAWHAAFGDPALADAIMDRVVHNAFKLQ